MRKFQLLFIVIVIFSSKFLMGQNLVPNFSFELMDSCPNSFAQFDRVKDWVVFKNTPDFMNSCDTSHFASVPYNCGGYQPAAIGNAYAGIHTFSNGGLISGGYKEYMGVPLISALVVGTKYFVSFKVSPTFLDSNCTTTCRMVSNKLGVFFTTVGYSYPGNQMPIPNYAHVYTDSIISDTAKWSIIRGSFIADTAYQYVAIGNFFVDSLNASFVMNPSGDYDLAYYYVDDVCVSTDSVYCETLTGIEENSWQTGISVYPNPCYDVLNVEVNNMPASTVAATVFDLNGRTVLNEKIKFINGLSSLDTRLLHSGMHLLLLQDKKVSQKIVFIKN